MGYEQRNAIALQKNSSQHEQVIHQLKAELKQSQEKEKALNEQLEQQRIHYERDRDEALKMMRSLHEKDIDILRSQNEKCNRGSLEQPATQQNRESTIQTDEMHQEHDKTQQQTFKRTQEQETRPVRATESNGQEILHVQ